MKSRLVLSIFALAGVATLTAHAANPEPAPAAEPKAERKARTVVVRAGEDAREKEKVTYLGVETGPIPEVLAEHLGIERDFGLTVRSVAKDSPASAVLQKNDVLRKLDDQLLVDPRQLSVLIRSRKPGSELKLTVIRAGKEQVVTAKLGEREVPKMFGMEFPERADGAMGFRLFNEDGPVVERLRELPGIAREELNDVIRIIGNERQNWVDGPRVRVVERRHKDGSTILNMKEGNFAFSDESGAVEIQAAKGERTLTVKDAQGKVLFEGPINTEEQRQALPTEVKERLKKLDTLSIDFKADKTLEQEGATVQPPPAKATRVQLHRVVPGGAVRPV